MGGKYRKFKPFKNPRYLPCTVKKMVWTNDLKDYNKHRYRVSSKELPIRISCRTIEIPGVQHDMQGGRQAPFNESSSICKPTVFSR